MRSIQLSTTSNNTYVISNFDSQTSAVVKNNNTFTANSGNIRILKIK